MTNQIPIRFIALQFARRLLCSPFRVEAFNCFSTFFSFTFLPCFRGWESPMRSVYTYTQFCYLYMYLDVLFVCINWEYVSRVQPGVGQYESVLYERKVSLWLGLVKVINFYMAVRSFFRSFFSSQHTLLWFALCVCLLPTTYTVTPYTRACVCVRLFMVPNRKIVSNTSAEERDVNARKFAERSAIAFGWNFRSNVYVRSIENGATAFASIRACVCVCVSRCDTRMSIAYREARKLMEKMKNVAQKMKTATHTPYGPTAKVTAQRQPRPHSTIEAHRLWCVL